MIDTGGHLKCLEIWVGTPAAIDNSRAQQTCSARAGGVRNKGGPKAPGMASLWYTLQGYVAHILCRRFVASTTYMRMSGSVQEG